MPLKWKFSLDVILLIFPNLDFCFPLLVVHSYYCVVRLLNIQFFSLFSCTWCWHLLIFIFLAVFTALPKLFCLSSTNCWHTLKWNLGSEVEKLKLSEMTCRQGVIEVAKMWVLCFHISMFIFVQLMYWIWINCWLIF